MCFGGSVARMTPPEREFKNRPVTVTGRQTGVDNPIDTAKFTENLRIQRQKEEGTYVDPNLTTTKLLGSKRTSRTNFSKQQQKGRDAARKRSQTMARARFGKKFGSSPTGRRTGVA